VPGPTAAEAGKLKQQWLQALGWAHWATHEQAWATVMFPAKLPPL
jgi:hypothetical protein